MSLASQRASSPSNGVLLVGTAGVVAVVAFAFRSLAMRDLSNDHYMHLAWAAQMLFGELPGRDFVEPGMPAMDALSALVQAAWPGPLSEALFCAAMLAVAIGATCYVTARVSGSLTAGIGAALLQMTLAPRLYSYPKALVPSVALLLLYRYVSRPSRGRVAALAAWTAFAFLLRHDLGLMTAIAVVAGLGFAAFDWRARLGTISQFVVAGLCFVAPYLVYVQLTEGLLEHIRVGTEFGKSDRHQLLFLESVPFPALASGDISAWGPADSIVLLFWLPHLLMLLTPLLLRRPGHDRRTMCVMVAAVVLLMLYRPVILRHSIQARIVDLSALIAICGAWTTVGIVRLVREWTWRKPLAAVAAGAITAVLVGGTIHSIWLTQNLREQFDNTGIRRGWPGILERARSQLANGRDETWEYYWPVGDMPEVVPYLRHCTAPTDRLLVTWFAPEFPFFARRPFAAGHPMFLPPEAFANDKDQALMLARLRTSSTPIALINETAFDEFRTSYPQVAEYLRRNYVVMSRFELNNDSIISVGVDKGLRWPSTYGPDKWPCRDTATPSRTHRPASGL